MAMFEETHNTSPMEVEGETDRERPTDFSGGNRLPDVSGEVEMDPMSEPGTINMGIALSALDFFQIAQPELLELISRFTGFYSKF